MKCCCCLKLLCNNKEQPYAFCSVECIAKWCIYTQLFLTSDQSNVVIEAKNELVRENWELKNGLH